MATHDVGYTLDAEGEALRQRHAAWWQRKGMLYHEAPYVPMGTLWLPLAGGGEAVEDMDVTPETLDVERLLGPDAEPGPLKCHEVTFAGRSAYGRVPWIEAILGSRIRATIQGGSMRTKSFIKSWDEWEASRPHRHTGWYELLLTITRESVARSHGRYVTTHTWMRGTIDLAEAVLGPEMIALSMYDTPDEFRRFMAEMADTLIEITNAQIALIPRVAGGCVNVYGIWAPGTTIGTQCDASAILSPAQYKRWILPYDEQVCAAFDYATIHLHSASLHTVPALLECKAVKAIQVSLDTEAHGPAPATLIPVFRDILSVKPLMIGGPIARREVDALREALPSDGLAMMFSIKTESGA